MSVVEEGLEGVKGPQVKTGLGVLRPEEGKVSP